MVHVWLEPENTSQPNIRSEPQIRTTAGMPMEKDWEVSLIDVTPITSYHAKNCERCILISESSPKILKLHLQHSYRIKLCETFLNV